MRTSLVALLLAAFGGSEAWAADPSFVVTEQVGQANFSTCQSYALAIALAFKRDQAFPINNWAQLRGTELAIRRAIEAARDARHGTEVSHADIQAGFDAYTGGRRHLRQRMVDLPDLGALAGSRSGVTSAGATPPTFLLGSVVNDVLLSSAISIAGYNYGGGHVFTILGVDGPPNSSRRYLILNSAARRNGQTRVACQDDLPDDAGPYEASLAWVPSSQIAFKTFGGRYSAWTVD